MLANLFLLAIPLKPIEFPEVPLSQEIDAGVRIFQLGKGVDRLYLDDRQVLGFWFNGKAKLEADAAVWLSPNLMSRWLGYLEAKEKWPDGELEKRWDRLRKDLGGHMTFVVRLCSMPRIDPIEGEIDHDADPRTSLDVRFLLTSSIPEKPHAVDKANIAGFAVPQPLDSGSGRRVRDGMRIEPKACLISEKQSHDWPVVLKEDWWLQVPFGESLRPEFSPCACRGLPLGEFFSSTYLVSFALPSEPFPAKQFEVRAFGPEKERIGRFSFLSRGTRSRQAGPR